MNLDKVLFDISCNNHSTDYNFVQRGLLRAGRENIKNEFGETPLHVACEEGDIVKVKRFIEEFGMNPDVQENYEGKTPLHEACRKGRTPIVYYLVEVAGADPTYKDKNGCTPFDHAFLCGHYDIIQYLVQKIAHISGSTKFNSHSLANQFAGCMHAKRSGHSLSHVFFIARSSFLEFSSLPSYESCVQKPGCLISGDELFIQGSAPNILFVSHRWEQATEPDPNGDCFKGITTFLQHDRSGTQVQVDYLWIDYTCMPIPPPLSSPSTRRPKTSSFAQLKDEALLDTYSDEAHILRIQNITTVLMACDHCLVVPQITEVYFSEKEVYCSNLCDLLRRAWCQYEVLVCLLMGCEVICMYAYGDSEDRPYSGAQEALAPSLQYFFRPIKNKSIWHEPLRKGGNLFKAASLEVLTFLKQDHHTLFVGLWDLWFRTDNFLNLLEHAARLVIHSSKGNKRGLHLLWSPSALTKEGIACRRMQEMLQPLCSVMGDSSCEEDRLLIALNLLRACSFLMNRVVDGFSQPDIVPEFFEGTNSGKVCYASPNLTKEYKEFLLTISPRKRYSESLLLSKLLEDREDGDFFTDDEESLEGSTDDYAEVLDTMNDRVPSQRVSLPEAELSTVHEHSTTHYSEPPITSLSSKQNSASLETKSETADCDRQESSLTVNQESSLTVNQSPTSRVSSRSHGMGKPSTVEAEKIGFGNSQMPREVETRCKCMLM